jgi:hypothetical protein
LPGCQPLFQFDGLGSREAPGQLADVAQPFFAHGGNAKSLNTGATRLITEDDTRHDQGRFDLPLQDCIKEVRKRHPDFAAQYDRGFFEGSSAVDGDYVCKITPKSLEEDHKSVMRIGRELLRLRTFGGFIEFERVPWEKYLEAHLDIINGNESRPAYVRFSRTKYTPDQLAAMLKQHFPQRNVQDVAIDGQSIFAKTLR